MLNKEKLQKRNEYQKLWRLKNHSRALEISRNSYKRKDPCVKAYQYMKNRCLPSATNRKNYFDKGIQPLISLEEIKILWNRDKAWLLEKPSLDRKDSKGNYTLNNCQFIELKENLGKDRRKITKQQEEDILLRIKLGESWREISKVYGVVHSTIGWIKKRKLYKNAVV